MLKLSFNNTDEENGKFIAKQVTIIKTSHNYNKKSHTKI